MSRTQKPERHVLLAVLLAVGPYCYGNDLETVAALFAAREREIQSIQITFEYQRKDREPCKVNLAWDMARDYVASTLVEGGAEGPRQIQKWYRNAKQDCFAKPLHGTTEVLPGAESVLILPRDGSGIRNRVARQYHGLQEVRQALVPPHISVLQAGRTQKGTPRPTTSIRSVEKDGDSALTRVRFDVLLNGKVVGNVIYEADLSDGLRIYSARMVADLGDAPPGAPPDVDVVKEAQYEYAGYRRSNGVWVPTSYKERMLRPDGSVMREVTLSVETATANPVLPDSRFTHVPPTGSLIYDAIAHVDYSMGPESVSAAEMDKVIREWEAGAASRNDGVGAAEETLAPEHPDQPQRVGQAPRAEAPAPPEVAPSSGSGALALAVGLVAVALVGVGAAVWWRARLRRARARRASGP